MLNLPGVREDVGLIGIHHQGQFIELVPWNGSIQWDVATWGRFAMYPTPLIILIESFKINWKCPYLV